MEIMNNGMANIFKIKYLILLTGRDSNYVKPRLDLVQPQLLTK